MNRLADYIAVLAIFAVLALTTWKLFPPGGHLGEEPSLLVKVIGLAAVAVIATIVVLIFRRTRGELSFKATLPGGVSVEFSGAHTQVMSFCLVFSLIAIFL